MSSQHRISVSVDYDVLMLQYRISVLHHSKLNILLPFSLLYIPLPSRIQLYKRETTVFVFIKVLDIFIYNIFFLSEFRFHEF